MTYIIYPEYRCVDDRTIAGWYADAVANHEVEDETATTVEEMAAALDDAGIITRGRR
jgi:hypothetical protein